MSSAREASATHLAHPEVSHLRLVEPAHVPPSPSTARYPESGVLWARAYKIKLLLSDALVIGLALTAALLVGTDFSRTPQRILELPPFAWASLVIVFLLWLAFLEAFRTRDCHVLGSGPDEYKRVVTACISAFGTVSIALLIGGVSFPGNVAVLGMAVGLLGLLVSRWTWRRWLSRQRKLGHALSRALVVGSPGEVDYVVSQISGNVSVAFDIVGVMTTPDSGKALASEGSRGSRLTPKQIAKTAASCGADAVIVAGDHGSGSHFIRHLAWRLEGTAAELILASRLANVAGPRIHFRPIEGLPLIHVEIPQFEGGKHVVKRVFDIVVSTVGLIVLSPVFLVLAVMIRLESPGGAVFRQVRVGRNLEPFWMYKFRSMVADAPERLADLVEHNEGSGVLFKMKNDPRVTPLGRVIRKYSLDELPQLWNVLKGDMSLVGPRPPLPCEVRTYRGKINRRMYIKPGLTGMWQINGRSDLSSEESTRLDLYYVENWSVVGDLVIMWRTVKAVVRPVGAY